MQATILIVDDEIEIADLIELYLENENYTVRKCHSAKDAYTAIEEGKIDLAILDIMLPDGDGFSICKKIREKYLFPVIMLTSKNDGLDKITGLTVGADDYMTKPFHPLELVARVKAQLRRYQNYNTSTIQTHNANIVAHAGLVLHLNTRECELNDKSIQLTPTEFSILWILCQRKGEVVTSLELFREIWGEDYFNNQTNPIPVHIRHIREKLNDSAEDSRYIKTVWGVGYKIEG